MGTTAVMEDTAASPPSPPLRVFLLVGQSNMEGKGSVEHLHRLLADNLTRSTYQHYVNDDDDNNNDNNGNHSSPFKSRDDVYVYFQDVEVRQGPLTVGFGDPPKDTFGPELEFGWIVGDDYNKKQQRQQQQQQQKQQGQQAANENTRMMNDDSVLTTTTTTSSSSSKTLLIKCAWGGKTLAVDFRSPSSGVGNYTKSCDDDEKKNQTHCIPYHPLEYGYYYRETISTVQHVLSNLPSILPSNYYYDDSSSSYEMAGLVWFQGWNDVIDDAKIDEYQDNLVHFLSDIRKDLEEPHLPVIIGELGQNGPVPMGWDMTRHNLLRQQMRRAVLRSGPHMTRYVMTSPYVNPHGPIPTYNGDYHYYGRCDTEFYIGRAFGTAMVQLMEDREDGGPQVHNATRTFADDDEEEERVGITKTVSAN